MGLLVLIDLSHTPATTIEPSKTPRVYVPHLYEIQLEDVGIEVTAAPLAYKVLPGVTAAVEGRDGVVVTTSATSSITTNNIGTATTIVCSVHVADDLSIGCCCRQVLMLLASILSSQQDLSHLDEPHSLLATWHVHIPKVRKEVRRPHHRHMFQ